MDDKRPLEVSDWHDEPRPSQIARAPVALQLRIPARLLGVVGPPSSARPPAALADRPTPPVSAFAGVRLTLSSPGIRRLTPTFR